MEKYLKQQQQNKAKLSRPDRQFKKVNEKNDPIILQYIYVSMDLV